MHYYVGQMYTFQLKMADDSFLFVLFKGKWGLNEINIKFFLEVIMGCCR